MNDAPKRQRPRRLIRFLAINLALVCLLLVGVEIVLRLARPAPAAGFVPELDDFRVFEQVAGADGTAVYRNRLADPATFGDNFGVTHQRADGSVLHIEEPFPDDRFTAEKSAGTFRIFIFGSSPFYAILPDREILDFGAHLRAVLGAAFPGRAFEVINLSNKALDQESMLIMLLEVLEYQPDLVLIYLGNISPTIHFDADRDLLFTAGYRNRVVRFLMGARLYRDLLAPLLFPAAEPVRGRDVMTAARTYGDTDQRALAAAEANLRGVYLDKTEVTLRHLANLARQRRVPLALYTIAVSLESPPINPLFAAGVPETDRRRIEELLRQAGENLSIDDRCSEAALREALALDETYAQTLYLLGVLYRRRGDDRAAAEYFAQAMQRDGDTMRVGYVLNPLLEKLCRRRHVPLLDIRPVASDQSAFADVTHFSAAGMDAIAELTARWLRESGLLD